MKEIIPMSNSYLMRREKRIIWSSWLGLERSCSEDDADEATGEDDADSEYYESLLDVPDFLDELAGSKDVGA